jgi:hypothetical protein
MFTEHLNTWDEFEKKILDLEEETKRLKNDPRAIWATTEVLYRGEGNADWPLPLSSTLERKHMHMTVGQYFDYIIEKNSAFLSAPELETLKQEIEKLNVDRIYLFPTQDANTKKILSVMAELRHKGFESPLVDWTSDPLVAAFFAFEGEYSESDKVAVYAFRERTGYTTDCTTGSTAIGIGHFIADPSINHIRQKSRYTLCIRQGYGVCFKDAHFASILEDINTPGFILLDNGETIEIPIARNVLRKYTLPVSERKSILGMLQNKGIDRKSLFPE